MGLEGIYLMGTNLGKDEINGDANGIVISRPQIALDSPIIMAFWN